MDTRSFDDGESVNLEYLRQSPAPSADGFPPSPMSSTNIARPRAPTPSASVPASDDETWSSNAPPHGGAGPVNLNSPTYQLQNTSQARHNFRHAPETDSNAYEQVSARPFARPAKALPDPSQFSDPYPNQGQPSRLSSHPPTLYSSSSASPRSSAYTTYSSRPPSNDYGHVRISSEEEDTSGIISSAVAQALESNGIVSSTPGSRSSRAPIDKSRWSEHGFSVRSRSSSISNTYGGGPSHDAYSSPPRLAHKPSYDASWATVDERDEVGISDEDDDFLGDFEEEDETELEDDQGDAVLAAEEGRGLIVRGDRRPVSQLHVQPGALRAFLHGPRTYRFVL
ncbi:hypothetical protein K525DRAFT_215614 [Schizophyllum commune Loenen D]|nr:hypothetical protein K525DRAFT_215614 [Schizophyllum commune Loenen D]